MRLGLPPTRASKQSFARTSKTTCTDHGKNHRRRSGTTDRGRRRDPDQRLGRRPRGARSVAGRRRAPLPRRRQAARAHVGQRRRRRRPRSCSAQRISRTRACSKRAITSALVDSPGLVRLAAEDKIEAYTLPQGVLSQLMRDMAAGRPGLLTKTGLNTFVDPRQQGARQSPRTPPDFVEVVNLAGEEWLFFKPVPVSVAFLRGTTADEDGNVTMEEEAVLGEMLAMAQATRRAGGIVIVQVKRMARRGTLPAKQVKIPGILVDFVVVDAEQRQTYATYYDPELLRRAAHSARRHQAAAVRPAQGHRAPRGDGALSGRRSAISAPAFRPACRRSPPRKVCSTPCILTNEQGLIGGAPITGRDSGGGQNFAAMIEQPAQFDFYDGGGLDLAFLSFAEVDARGQRQRQPLRRQDHRRRRLHQHQPEREMRDLQRHADGRRSRHRLGGRPHRHPQGRAASQVRAEARADLLQREHGPRSAARSRCSSPSARCSASARTASS